MKKVIYSLLLVFVLHANFSCARSDERSASRTANLKIANVLLFHVKHDIELIHYCRGNLGDNTILITKLEESLYRKISEVSSTAPSLEDLGGSPLNAIASVINYQNTCRPLYSGPYRNQVVDNYLQLITDSLLKQKDKYGNLPTTPLIEFYRQHGLE